MSQEFRKSRQKQFLFLFIIFLILYFFVPKNESSYFWRLPPLLKDIPNNFKIIAMSHLLVSGVSHQNKPHYGVMFHPERSGVAGDKILLNFLQ